MNELKLIERWLKKPGNSPAKLAAALGYKASNTISMWMARRKIPAYMVERVRDVCRS